MNTLKINVPEGFEIDKDKSTFEEIVFKPIVKELPKRWEDLENITGWYASSDDVIEFEDSGIKDASADVFVTKEQAQAVIALAKLSQLREVYRQGWEPDWKNPHELKYCIGSIDGEIYSSVIWRCAIFLSFQSEQVRNEFLKNFKDLIEEASPLLFG